MTVIGSCDCCERKNVPLSRVDACGIETYACFICQGDADPDPYDEMGGTVTEQAPATSESLS